MPTCGCLIAALLLLATSAGDLQAQTTQQAEAKAQDEAARKAEVKHFWIFLTTGKAPEGVTPEEIAKMQEAHLGNFRRLAEAGDLSAAGPMADPEKKLRGIVVLQAEDEAALTEMFKPDPFVEHRILNVEAVSATFSIGRFSPKLDAASLDEFRIAVITGEKSAPAWIVESDLRMLADLADVKLVLAAKFHGDSDRKGCLIFHSQDDAKIKAALNGLAPFVIQELKYSLMPQYLGKGAIEPAVEDSDRP